MNLTELIASTDWTAIPLFFLIMGWDDVLIALALFVVSSTITALTAKKPAAPSDAVASQLKDFQIPTVEEGTAQTVIFGDCWVKGAQVLWYGDLRTEAIRSARTGGKK